MSTSASAEPRTDQTESLTTPQAQKQQGKPCLQLKGSLVPMTVLELSYYDNEQLKNDLDAKVSQAPDFFENLPVVISLEKLAEHEQVDFKQLVQVCAEFSIKVVAIRGGSEIQQGLAKQAGLGLLAKQKERTTKNDTIDTYEPADAALEKTEQTQVSSVGP